MFIVRDKSGEIITIASREEDVVGMTQSKLDGEEYVVQKYTDQQKLHDKK